MPQKGAEEDGGVSIRAQIAKSKLTAPTIGCPNELRMSLSFQSSCWIVSVWKSSTSWDTYKLASCTDDWHECCSSWQLSIPPPQLNLCHLFLSTHVVLHQLDPPKLCAFRVSVGNGSQNRRSTGVVVAPFSTAFRTCKHKTSPEPGKGGVAYCVREIVQGERRVCCWIDEGDD